MNYGPDVVAQVLDELGVDVVSEHGDWGQASCPLHDDVRPSFTVNLLEGGWKCYSGCGSSGDLAVLVAEVTDEPLADVRRRLRRRMPADESALLNALSEADREEAEAERRRAPLFYEHGVAPKYMLNRGFTLETLKAWDVGWDSETQAVVLPATEDGETVGLIRRRLSGRPKYQNSNGFVASERGYLFGLDHVPVDAKWVSLWEGPLDAMWVWQCGFPAVAQLGSSLSVRQADALKRRFWRVVLGYDADKAGRAAQRQAREALSSLRLQVFPIERGKKDVQESSCEYVSRAMTELAEAGLGTV